jgi:hypothetical protein
MHTTRPRHRGYHRRQAVRHAVADTLSLQRAHQALASQTYAPVDPAAAAQLEAYYRQQTDSLLAAIAADDAQVCWGPVVAPIH